MAYRSRDILVRQRTQLINALRGHLAEFGVVAPQGITQIKKLAAAIDAPEAELPELVRQLAHDHLDMIGDLTARIAVLDRTLQRVTATGEKTAYIRTVPGVGPIAAAAIEAWLGLVPKQHSTVGKERLTASGTAVLELMRKMTLYLTVSVRLWL